MLYIVSTPIGNLKDISERAMETLKNVDVVICEDILDAKRLLSALNIRGKELIKYNDKNKRNITSKIIELLLEKDGVYITAAGTPGISDPGTDLVREAREKGIETRIIPGPSALTSAIAMSGIRAREFTFISFPPKGPGKLRNLLDKYKKEKSVLVFFESTHRIIKTIKAIHDIAPDSYVFIAKEMTKMFERYFYGTPKDVLAELEEDPKNTKGEFVVIAEFKRNKTG